MHTFTLTLSRFCVIFNQVMNSNCKQPQPHHQEMLLVKGIWVEGLKWRRRMGKSSLHKFKSITIAQQHRQLQMATNVLPTFTNIGTMTWFYSWISKSIAYSNSKAIPQLLATKKDANIESQSVKRFSLVSLQRIQPSPSSGTLGFHQCYECIGSKAGFPTENVLTNDLC